MSRFLTIQPLSYAEYYTQFLSLHHTLYLKTRYNMMMLSFAIFLLFVSNYITYHISTRDGVQKNVSCTFCLFTFLSLNLFHHYSTKHELYFMYIGTLLILLLVHLIYTNVYMNVLSMFMTLSIRYLTNTTILIHHSYHHLLLKSNGDNYSIEVQYIVFNLQLLCSIISFSVIHDISLVIILLTYTYNDFTL